MQPVCNEEKTIGGNNLRNYAYFYSYWYAQPMLSASLHKLTINDLDQAD